MLPIRPVVPAAQPKMPLKCLSRESYQVVWICPLEVEQIAAMEMLDEEHQPLPQPSGDTNVYNLGSINNHNVIIAGLPVGNCSAATIVTQTMRTFPNLKYGLLVGIGGGVPTKTECGMIRLGHVVVSEPTGIHSGAVQYDRGKAIAGHFERKVFLAPPPIALLNAAREVAVQRQRMDYDPIWENLQRIQTNRRIFRRFKFPGAANDHLYPPTYTHRQQGITCEKSGCDPKQRIERPTIEGSTIEGSTIEGSTIEGSTIERLTDEEDGSFIVVHRGTIALGEVVIKDAKKRDDLAQEHRVLCFETEAAGFLTDFPCMVIRGISDYCDSHKDDQWHGYAAAVAAAYARQLFFHMSIEEAQRNSNLTPTVFELPFDLSEVFEVTCFVGREDQLKTMQEILNTTAWRRTAVVHGSGGIGKTQLAIAYIKRNRSHYSATIWLNARDKTALKQSFARAAEWILRHHPSVTYIAAALESRDLDETVNAVKRWLDEPMNDRWLVVYDNYDNPLLYNHTGRSLSYTSYVEAGTISDDDEELTKAFDLRKFLPESDHGAIVVTTRSSMVELGQPLLRLHLRLLEDINDSLKILASVSGRENLRQDPAATDLARQLDGLPLALARAGAYLEQVSISCTGYLQLYRESWQRLYEETPTPLPQWAEYDPTLMLLDRVADVNAQGGEYESIGSMPQASVFDRDTRSQGTYPSTVPTFESPMNVETAPNSMGQVCVGLGEESRISDEESIYSARTDVTPAEEQVSEISDVLLEYLENDLPDVSALNRISGVLEELLRLFAMQLEFEIKSQVARDAMVFIRRYRK
ncbi:Disease resistance protein [Penicillium canescens]|nr:Disease resistance protein [Penicillium canescens]